MFKILGVGVALYALHAASAGEVVARSGPGMRRVSREESPTYFWVVIAVYLCLGAALVFVF